MRGLSELYSVILLVAVTALAAPAVYRLVNSYYEASRVEYPPLSLVYRVNDTHALCITIASWRPVETLAIGNFSFWVYSGDIDGDGLLDPTQVSFNSTIEAGTYVLVTPPWPCK